MLRNLVVGALFSVSKLSLGLIVAVNIDSWEYFEFYPLNPVLFD